MIIKQGPDGKFCSPGNLLHAWLPKFLEWHWTSCELSDLLTLAAKYSDGRVAHFFRSASEAANRREEHESESVGERTEFWSKKAQKFIQCAAILREAAAKLKGLGA